MRRLGGIAAALLLALPAQGFEARDGRLQLHGFYEAQIRGLADDYHPNRAYFSPWAQ